MNKIIIPAIIIIVVAILAFAGFRIFNGSQSGKCLSISEEIKIFFYSDTCPHCKIVEDYMAANSVEDSLAFRKLEVRNNADNANMLVCRAQKCGIKDDDIGVPLFWDGKTCIMGDEPIINYFKEQMKPVSE